MPDREPGREDARQLVNDISNEVRAVCDATLAQCVVDGLELGQRRADRQQRDAELLHGLQQQRLHRSEGVAARYVGTPSAAALGRSRPTTSKPCANTTEHIAREDGNAAAIPGEVETNDKRQIG